MSGESSSKAVLLDRMQAMMNASPFIRFFGMMVKSIDLETAMVVLEIKMRPELERVPGTIINLHVDAALHCLHGFLKLVHVLGRNPTILRSEIPQHGSEDLLDVIWIGRQGAVIDNTSSQARLVNREL